MVREFPDESQRRAVCERQWQEGESNMPMKVKGEAPQRLADLRQSTSDEIGLSVNAQANNEYDIYLYDVIGFPFIEAQDLLYQIPKNAKQVNLHINSPGGDVFEGMAIYNFFASHQADVSVMVDGLAASSASLIAMSGKTRRMAKASFMMIHNPWSMMVGDAQELRKEADLLDKISDTFADAYAEQSGKSKKEVLSLMQAETWFQPEEAIQAGLAHEMLTDTSDATSTQAGFNLSIFGNVPKALVNHSGSQRTAQTAGAGKTGHTEVNMPKEIRDLLERLGLSSDATEQQAWDYLAGLDLNQIETKEERDKALKALAEATKPADQDTQNGGSASISQEDLQQATREAIKAEKQRAKDIRESVRIAGLDNSFAEELIDQDVDADQARQKILAKMKETNPPVGAGGIQVGADEADKFRSAVADGLARKSGIRLDNPAPGSEDFRGATIENVARKCLERAGVDTRRMQSRDEVARAVLRQAASGGFSTDDFTSIFLDVANKNLMKAYREAPNTWRPFVNVVSASDFKDIYGIALSEAPDLELIDEHGEYKHGEMSDSQEKYSVGTYGKIMYLTRKMIVNDDLRAFTRLPRLMGAAARRKESDIVWGKITGNPTMNDGNSLFDSSNHSNLETSGSNVDSDSLESARAAMRKQTGPNGAILDLQPQFLLVPVAQETSAEILLRSTMLPVSQANADYNPWANRLTPIAEPRLDNDSTDAWYLVADPSQIDTIEVAYLDGNEAPYTEEEVMFERDAIGYKVRHDFGAGVMDWRGFYKNSGSGA